MNNPTPTGEPWTAASVREIGGHYSIRQQRDQAIADAHNAAIKQTYEKLDAAVETLREAQRLIELNYYIDALRGIRCELEKIGEK